MEIGDIGTYTKISDDKTNLRIGVFYRIGYRYVSTSLGYLINTADFTIKTINHDEIVAKIVIKEE